MAAVGAETAIGIALPLLECCNRWYGCSEEGGGDLAASYWTLGEVREARGLAFDNRNSGPRFHCALLLTTFATPRL
jgi:hypothetical protein